MNKSRINVNAIYKHIKLIFYNRKTKNVYKRLVKSLKVHTIFKCMIFFRRLRGYEWGMSN